MLKPALSDFQLRLYSELSRVLVTLLICLFRSLPLLCLTLLMRSYPLPCSTNITGTWPQLAKLCLQDPVTLFTGSWTSGMWPMSLKLYTSPTPPWTPSWNHCLWQNILRHSSPHLLSQLSIKNVNTITVILWSAAISLDPLPSAPHFYFYIICRWEITTFYLEQGQCSPQENCSKLPGKAFS